jgi:hypothetical protein
MNAREIQAENLAKELVKHASANHMGIFIHGKAYKPNVAYQEGSYSLLVGSYLREMGIDPVYIDPLTEESNPASVVGCVLLAHNQQVTYGYSGVTDVQPLYTEILSGSVVIDPWRSYTTSNTEVRVIHYGNTRLC